MPKHDIIRRAIELGRDKGFLTFGELNELLLDELWPSTTMALEDAETILAALNDKGIDVIEDERP